MVLLEPPWVVLRSSKDPPRSSMRLLSPLWILIRFFTGPLSSLWVLLSSSMGLLNSLMGYLSFPMDPISSLMGPIEVSNRFSKLLHEFWPIHLDRSPKVKWLLAEYIPIDLGLPSQASYLSRFSILAHLVKSIHNNEHCSLLVLE